MIYIKKWLEYYEELFTAEENQIEFIENLVSDSTSPKKVLSVECGPAEISKYLCQKDYDITAIDTYQEFVNALNNNQTIDKTRLHAFNLIPQDIGRYLGQNFFDLIMCCNYRLIFLKNKAMITKFMIDCNNLLNKNGVLVLDLINFSKFDFSNTKIDLPERSSERATLYSYLLKNSETASYYMNQYIVTSSGKKIDDIVDEEICPISLETFKKLAEETNFSSIEFFSDYKGNPLKADSDKIICVLRK